MRSVPRGGLGNRILNHFNLQSIASGLGVDYFSANVRDVQFIPGIYRPRVVRLTSKNLAVFGRTDVENSQFFEKAKEALRDGKVIALRPRLLLDSFAWTETAGAQITRKTRAKRCSIHRAESEGRELVFHLRGGDFKSWNPEAILSLDYYVEASEIATREFSEFFSVRIATDDQNHPALDGLRKYLRQKDFPLASELCESPLACDFRAMIDADVLVASPSTLSLSAAIIGSARTIHSQQWLDSNGKTQEYFWDRLNYRKIRSIDVMATV